MPTRRGALVGACGVGLWLLMRRFSGKADHFHLFAGHHHHHGEGGHHHHHHDHDHSHGHDHHHHGPPPESAKTTGGWVRLLLMGLGGGLIAHFYGYISYDSFLARESILTLTMVVLGGMSSIPGAFVGSLALIGIPELFRPLADYRYILYGILLLLVIRYRPRGLIGGP